MTAIAVTRFAAGRSNRLVAKLRGEDGLGLVELLIALLVLNIGIFATLGAFTSAATAINRASRVSTAAAVADKQMETYRDSAYASIPSTGTTTTSVTGADGRTYSVVATFEAGTQVPAGGVVTYAGSTSVKKVTLIVKDVADQNRVLVTSSSTFSRCTQSGMGSDTSACSS